MQVNQRIAVISAHDEWSEIVSKIFIEEFQKREGAIDFHETIDIQEKNVGSLILKLKRTKTPAVFFPLYSVSLMSIIRKAKELGYQGKMITGDGLLDEDLKSLGGLANGVYGLRIWIDNPEFMKEYQKHYKRDIDPLYLGYVAMGYDAMKLAHLTKIKLDATDTTSSGAAVARILPSIEFEGVTGRTVLSKESNYRKPQTLIHIQQGQAEKVLFSNEES